jgi:hypothetical protein
MWSDAMQMTVPLTSFARRAVLGLLFLISGSVFAHIKNEASQFPDIEYSDARFDIVVLVGAGIIPETPVFEPDMPLSMRDLASWAALAGGLARGGEVPDVNALATLALEKGLVPSLAGSASYEDLNRLFLSERLTFEDAKLTPTKGEAASLIASQLGSQDGKLLLDKLGIAPGPTGEVGAVTTRTGHHGNVYVLEIGDAKLEMDAHGRVANGPTDLLQWPGRAVMRSFVRGEGDHARLIYVEAAPRTQPASIDAAEQAGSATQVITTIPNMSAAAGQSAKTVTAGRRLFYWLVLGVFILGVGLFFRRRRSH